MCACITMCALYKKRVSQANWCHKIILCLSLDLWMVHLTWFCVAEERKRMSASDPKGFVLQTGMLFIHGSNAQFCLIWFHTGGFWPSVSPCWWEFNCSLQIRLLWEARLIKNHQSLYFVGKRCPTSMTSVRHSLCRRLAVSQKCSANSIDCILWSAEVPALVSTTNMKDV